MRRLLFAFTFLLTAFLFGSHSWAQKTKASKFFVPQISVKITFSGDMSGGYQFAGPLGDRLKGAPEKPDSVCENTSSFQKVLHRHQKSLQIWMSLKCGVGEQSFEYRPQRFFVDLKKPDKPIEFPVLSEKFRKISMQLSELQIKDTPPKK